MSQDSLWVILLSFFLGKALDKLLLPILRKWLKTFSHLFMETSNNHFRQYAIALLLIIATVAIVSCAGILYIIFHPWRS